MTKCVNCGHDPANPVSFSCVARDHQGYDREWCGKRHPSLDDAERCEWRPSGAVHVAHCNFHNRGCWEIEDMDVIGGVAHLSIYMLRDYDPSKNEPCPHGEHKTECRRCNPDLPVVEAICVHGENPATCGRCVEL